MSGSYRKRKSSWQFIYMYKGNTYYGKASFAEAPTEHKAKQLLEEFCNNVRKGSFTNTTGYTFEDVALLWLEQVAKPNYSPIVVKNYVKNLNNHTLPFFNNTRIADINSLMIYDYINTLQKKTTNYQHRTNTKLKNETIKTIYKNFHTIMKYAYNNDIISTNPCDKIKLQLPKQVETSKHFYNKQEYNKLLELLEDVPLDKQVAIHLALKTGMRRSELWGLKWQDVDLDNKVIVCNKTRQKIGNIMRVLPTKNQSSIRTISIPTSLVRLLKKYKKVSESEFILTMDYDSITKWFRDWLKYNGLPHIKFHDLRHTHATLLLAEGIDIKTIQHRLGHSDIHTTLNTYAHFVDEQDFKASKVLDKI